LAFHCFQAGRLITNKFYSVTFNKDGSFSLYDKITDTKFEKLHFFEDYGDRGDEYTFGKLNPVVLKSKKNKRKLVTKGNLFSEIKQTGYIETFKQVNEKRDKRIGKTKIPIESTFKFYRDIPRIDIKTKLTNTAKDHRIRVCFNLPFKSEKTLTETHFGLIERNANPPENQNFIEQPSGIQPQKSFIRIENQSNNTAITLMNKGLPEIEFYDNHVLALTLLRSIGFLSRSDFPERPIHAGPFLETPGAQELGKEYVFNYSIMIHEKEKPYYFSKHNAEAFTLDTTSLVTKESKSENKFNQIINVENPWICISSIRYKEDKIVATLYNLNDEEITTDIYLNPKLVQCNQILLNQTKVKNIDIIKQKASLIFSPYEIKMLEFIEK